MDSGEHGHEDRGGNAGRLREPRDEGHTSHAVRYEDHGVRSAGRRRRLRALGLGRSVHERFILYHEEPGRDHGHEPGMGRGVRESRIRSLAEGRCRR